MTPRYSMARCKATALEFTQAVDDLAEDHQARVCFEFPFPPGTVVRSIELSPKFIALPIVQPLPARCRLASQVECLAA